MNTTTRTTNRPTRTVTVTGSEIPSYYLGRRRDLWITAAMPAAPIVARAA